MYLKFKYLFLTLIILVTLYLTILISSIIGIIIAIDENDPNKLNYYIHNQLLNQNLNLFFSKNLQENFENKIFTIDIGNGTFSGELSNETIDIFITKVSNILSKDLSSSEALLYFYYHSKDLNQYFKKVFLNSEKYSFQEFLNEADKQKINLSQNVTNEKEILEELLPLNFAVQIFKALLESSASEQGSRMSAMDNASRNASDMIDSLTLFYNRSRQAVITKELIEIISGAEAV